MFLSSLSYEQRKVFLGLAKEILTVDDGKIDGAEDSYLRAICAEMSLSFNDEKKVTKKELLQIFDDFKLKKLVLLELVALGYSNMDYDVSQDKYTDEIAELLEVPVGDLRKIEDLLKKYYEIKSEFINLIRQ
jgi:uncharacterized tellurite resistance protein B-like protein